MSEAGQIASAGLSTQAEDAFTRELDTAHEQSITDLPAYSILQEQYKTHEGNNAVAPLPTFEEYYDIAGAVQWVTSHGYTKIALQFPDTLLQDATQVSSTLQSSLSDTLVYVLGDTSYGSCCVDEVAAAHLNADAVIHYGRSCLSQTTRLPVYLVLGRAMISVSHCIESVTASGEITIEDTVILYPETVYAHIVPSLAQSLAPLCKTVICPEIPSLLHPIGLAGVSTSPSPGEEKRTSLEDEPLTFNNMSFPSTNAIGGAKVLHIGGETPGLTNVLLEYSDKDIYSYRPAERVFTRETVARNMSLMRRYYLVQKTKDAATIGLLVGTLGVARYLDVLERLKALVTKAGKKYYTFVVGKLNEPKLANFNEIDVYVLVACPENSLIDSNQYYTPVVTPFELEKGLADEDAWTGEYTNNFKYILQFQPSSSTGPAAGDVDKPDEEDEDGVRMSIVDGTIKPGLRPRPAVEIAYDGSTDLVARQAAMALTVTDAGRQLAAREFQGLDPKLGQTAVTSAVEGRGLGIARGYDGEGDDTEGRPHHGGDGE